MDVDGIKFEDMKVAKADDAPYFVLKNVKNFKTKEFLGVKDKIIDFTEDLEIRK